ncbi:MAG: hypothetical protein LHV69_11325 [Elusimicrobia bacterium]|nr:hypothetical protein [Candidatus Obscuribacterium magneticum]
MITIATTISFADPRHEYPIIYSPGLEPAGIAVGQSVIIQFSGTISGMARAPENLLVEEVDKQNSSARVLGHLFDNGKNGDHVRGDGVYTGQLRIKGSVAGFRHFRLLARVDNREIVSSASRLWVTNYPFASTATEKKIIKDSVTGDEMYANEILVSFHEGVTEERIKNVINAENGHVLMVVPGLFIFQIGGTGKDTADAVKQWAASFQSHQEVATAEPNMIIGLNGMSPSNKSLKPTNPAQGDR